jgi:hypothetical protein
MAAKRQAGTKDKRAKARKAEALRRRREILDALLKVLRGT